MGLLPERNRKIFRRSYDIPTIRLAAPERKRHYAAAVKYWEIIADKLKKAGWSLGWVSAVDSEGRTIWIAEAHRDDGKRFVVREAEKLTAFLELDRVTRESMRFSNAQ